MKSGSRARNFVLKPFFEATKSLSGEKYSTASVVIVLTRGLVDVIGKVKRMTFSEPVEEVVREQRVKDKIGNVESDTLLLISMFLDPRFKFCFDDTILAERVRVMAVNAVATKLKTPI